MSTTHDFSIELGALVHVRYLDHVLFRNANPETQRPIVQEVIGWLHAQNDDYVRLLVAQYPEPGPNGQLKATGFAIVKRAILEMRRIG